MYLVVEMQYVSASDWDGETVYEYRVRAIQYESWILYVMQSLFGLFGTVVWRGEVSSDAYKIAQYVPYTIEPPAIQGTPVTGPLYLLGMKSYYADGLSQVPITIIVRGCTAYYSSQDRGRSYPNYPGTQPPVDYDDYGPDGTCRDFLPKKYSGTKLQTIYYRNTQEGVSEYYPEYLWPWAGAVPGPSHFLYYLSDPNYTPQVLGDGILRMQNLVSPYGGREEYLLNDAQFSLPPYVEYEWTYLPPYPGHSAGTQEIWWMELCVPVAGEEPIYDERPEPASDEGLTIPEDLLDGEQVLNINPPKLDIRRKKIYTNSVHIRAQIDIGGDMLSIGSEEVNL